MRANSLSISIPVGRGGKFVCNKHCPYCISKMTGLNVVDYDAFLRHLPKAERMAQTARVRNVIITGKTEPTLNMNAMYKVGKYFRNYPLEIQTNGILLQKEPKKYLTEFIRIGIDTIAISIDSIEQLEECSYLFSYIKSMGMTSRITVNLTDLILGVKESYSIKDFIDFSNNFGIDELSFRKVVKPYNPIDTEESEEAQKWIDENVSNDLVDKFEDEYAKYVKENGRHIKHLSFGADLYMVDGVSCVVFEHCIQEENDDEKKIRSLIYFEDGHMSTSWYGSNFGRIF